MKTLPNTYPVCLDDVETYLEQAWHDVADELPEPIINNRLELEPVLCLVVIRYRYPDTDLKFDQISICNWKGGKWDRDKSDNSEIIQWAYAHELVPDQILKSVYR